MMGFRRFTIGISLVLIVYVGLNALIWFGWTREITDPRRNGGDLLRIGYILGNMAKRQNVDDLPKQHIKVNEYRRQHVDLVTVGDSFSIGGGGGRNSHYQDYIASLQGMTVLNVPSNVFRKSGGAGVAPITTLSKLINSGYLDIIKPKYLLLESVERLAIQRCTQYYSMHTTASPEEIDRSFHEWRSLGKQKNDKRTPFRFINNGNWKFIGNNVQYHFKDEARNSEVIISKLTRRFFSTGQGDKLIFIGDDSKSCSFSTPASVAEANRNLNHLASVLKAKGIVLVFMPVVDKLTLYEPYLQKHRYPKSIFFEELRKLPKDYLFIDTKEILARKLEKGELDIYHQDDSHWTWKASEAIFSAVRISELQYAGK
jgi:hypothetical protein